jgi:molybdenum cofactor cytidylyltransferase
MKEGGKLAAIIPAAGRSQRMGCLKPLLLFGAETMTERVVRVAREAGVAEILVVLGYGAELIIPLLEDRGIAWVLNPEFDTGMYTSVQAGVLRHSDADVDGFLVLPGDMPMVRSTTLQLLRDRFSPGQGRIVHPYYQGRRGHPPLIDAVYRRAILAEHPLGGLRELLARYPDATLEVDCDDPGVLIDVDTPEAYQWCLSLMASRFD